MTDYAGTMVYRRWRSALLHWGYGELGWRWECQFYGLLGRFYLMDQERPSLGLDEMGMRLLFWEE